MLHILRCLESCLQKLLLPSKLQFPGRLVIISSSSLRREDELGDPRSTGELWAECEDAVPCSPQLPLPPPPPQQAPAGEVSLEEQVQRALLHHGLSPNQRRTRSEVVDALRPHLPQQLPTVMAYVSLVSMHLLEGGGVVDLLQQGCCHLPHPG